MNATWSQAELTRRRGILRITSENIDMLGLGGSFPGTPPTGARIYLKPRRQKPRGETGRSCVGHGYDVRSAHGCVIQHGWSIALEVPV